MPTIELRKKSSAKSPEDVTVTVQDKTFDYLKTSTSHEIRISTYFDRDYETIDEHYGYVFVSEDCPFESKITTLSPGSQKRKDIALPGPMFTGEQLVVTVKRRSLKG